MKAFAINILATDQIDVSNRFAKSGPDKWQDFNFETWDSGVPIIHGCLANLECRVDSIMDGGDHVIVIGEVERMTAADEGTKPILYYRGGYKEISF